MEINPIDLDADADERTAGGVLADPRKGKAAPRVAAAPHGIDPITGLALAEAPMASPATAVYTPPPKGAAHPKVPRKAAADRLNAAEANLTAASLEVSAAYNALRDAERIETAAHQVLIDAMPGPTADQVHRDMIAKEAERKLARIAEGKPAVEARPVTARSPLDLAAAQRPRTSAQGANAPLFSPVPRFTV